MADRVKRGEAGIIRDFFAPLAADVKGAFGLNDDAGQITPPDGHSVVLTADAIVEGVHYITGSDPTHIGYKALAVNVSDLCAKGAEPEAYLLTIAVPETHGEDWLAGICEGLVQAQAGFGCGLLGGDTVRTNGPAVLSITAAGYLPDGNMVGRSGAGEGDLVYVTGTVGDAALGLELLRGDARATGINLPTGHSEFLIQRYRRPSPRIEAIALVRDFASASMDVSDGLVGDLMKLCEASEVGGTLKAGAIPLSDAGSAFLEQDPASLETILTGGDDYELLMTVPSGKRGAFEARAASLAVQVTAIGDVSASAAGAEVLDKNGKAIKLERPGYDHF